MSLITRLLGIVTKKELELSYQKHTEIFHKPSEKIAEIDSQLIAHESRLNEIAEAFIGHLGHIPEGKRFAICYKEINSQIDKGQAEAIKVGVKLEETVNLFTVYKNEHLDRHTDMVNQIMDLQADTSKILNNVSVIETKIDDEKKDRIKAVARCNERLDKFHKDMANRKKVRS
jgi:hypothetical protein